MESTLDLARFFSAVGRPPATTSAPAGPAGPAPAPEHAGPDESEPFAAALAALIWNVEPIDGRLPAGRVHQLLLDIDARVTAQLNEILHHPDFQATEATWRGLDALVAATNFRANVRIDLLDVSKDELHDDLEAGSVDVSETTPFRIGYIEEYDQFGGCPYGAFIGLYEFSNTPRDILWLRQMAKIAALTHAPFISSVSPAFFGFDSAEQLAAARDLSGLLKHPRYSSWHALRDAPESSYVALTLPRYLVRAPWTPEGVAGRAEGLEFPFVEDVGRAGQGYLWGNAALLFARNLVRSFEKTGWCQAIRGRHGGGAVPGLVSHTFRLLDERVRKPPVEVVIPDWAELSFANAGFIALLARPDSDEACFFSCQSVRAPKRSSRQIDSERSQIHSNLAYTLSAARIAQYLKCIVRDNIGAVADASFIQAVLRRWLEGYVTTIASPDDKTLRFYPFKGARVVVERAEGIVGKFNCLVAVAPHIQFEGIDVELRLESRVG